METITAAVHILSPKGVGKKIGYIHFRDSQGGLLIEPELEGLPAGEHGFHIHEFGNLEPKRNKDGKMVAGLSAGQHYDPENAGFHGRPDGFGHRGDLPVLEVDEDGVAEFAVLAPRLSLNEIKGRAIIIHKCGDNYSDHPLPNGGGKSRIAGGVITNSCPYCEKQKIQTIGTLALIGMGFYAWKNR